ncbi:MAG TPA: thiol oxidoreductase, partial [Pusillimonas sp.]|nr:thiol oxidoreductase [Pusillimonas sp.]
PLFNARSCQACHVKDGRGTVPGFDPEALTGNMALLIRLSLAHNQNEAVDSVIEALEAPDPVYGHQFQPFAVPGLSREGDLQIRYESQEVALNGGETVELMKPVYELTDLAYGPLHKDVRLSPRLASPMVGLGL